MNFETALLIFGILLLIVGLVGQVEAKELKIGTGNVYVRVILGVIGILFVLLSFNPQGFMSMIASKLDKESIRIINVTYGMHPNYCNATNFLKTYCESRTNCDVIVNNAMCGDPIGGILKEARIDYFCAGHQSSLTVQEGSMAHIACP